MSPRNDIYEASRSRFLAYGIGLAAVVAGLFFRWYLHPVLGERGLYSTYLPAVIAAAYFGGLWPGLVITATAAVANNLLLVAPIYDLEFKGTGDTFALVLFLLAGAFISVVCELLHRARRRIVAEERRRVEALLHETEERFRQLAENIHEIFWMTNASGDQVIYISPGYEEVWGRTCESLREQPGSWLDSIHPEDRERGIEHATQNQQGVFTDSEFRVVRPDGSVRWIRSRAFPIADADGRLNRIAGLAEDITQRKQIENTLRENETRLHRMLDGLPAAAYTCDTEGMITYFNDRATELWGRSPRLNHLEDRFCGSFKILEGEDRIVAHDQCWMAVAVREGREVKGRAAIIERSDGSRRNVLVYANPLWDSEGNLAGAVNVLVDVTEQKQAVEALRGSEERFRSTFENAGVGIALCDIEGNFVSVNQKFAEIVDYSDKELFGRSYRDITHPEDTQIDVEQIDQILRGDIPSYSIEKRYVRKDGSHVWVELSGSVLQRDPAGRPLSLIGIIQDISERKRLAEDLSKANERLDLAVRGSNLTVWELEMPDGIVETGHPIHINGWEPLGYDPREAPGDFSSMFDKLVGREDHARVMRAIEACLSGETKEYEVEYRVRHKNGSQRWHLARGVAVRDGAGRPVRFVGSTVDITDLKRAEAALRESEERFRGTFENAAVGIAHCDSQGHYLRVNERYCEIVGYSREELLGMTFMDVTHPDDAVATTENFVPLMHGDVPRYSQEKRLVRKDGSTVWIQISGSLQKYATGEPAHSIGVVQDISERKRLETDLRQAKDLAEGANRAKDEFLANVSHEIRTPMNAILGMTELVLDTSLAEDQRQSLNTVKSAADNLLGLINDLLDFSKIEAGKLELEDTDFSLRAVLGDTLRALAIRAHRKGLELISHVQSEVPDALIGDPSRLRQVLTNLVGNAIKFTKQGEVVVRVESRSIAPAHDQVDLRISISDTGVGIPREKQAAIFRAFEQEDSSTTRKYGGTGLGLTIAVQIAKLMGGDITVVSEPNQGSVFHFTARFGVRPQFSKRAAAPPDLIAGLRVLIVDDNATNRQILGEWLRAWQMDPAAVGDGVSTLDALWSAVAAGRPFELVLLDARMPDTDGLALVAKIRQRAEFSAARIILLTSGDRPGDLARLRKLKIDAHVLKPVPQEDLLDTIHRVMSRTKDASLVEPAPPPAREPVKAPVAVGGSPRILVAEDNEFSAQLMQQLLTRRGYNVQLVNNGRDALELSQDSDIALLLLDVHMPELDGFQVVSAIRQREEATGGHLPVIALTARSRREDRDRCLAAGMDDFLIKPAPTTELFAAIERMLSTRKTLPRLEPHIVKSRLTVLDPVAVLTTCGDDAEGLQGMCQDFQTYVPERLAETRDALRDRDAPRLRMAAHKLCPLFAAFSTMAGDVASELEDRATQGQLDEAAPLVENLEKMAQELMRLVDSLSLEELRLHAEAVRGRQNGDVGP